MIVAGLTQNSVGYLFLSNFLDSTLVATDTRWTVYTTKFLTVSIRNKENVKISINRKIIIVMSPLTYNVKDL